MMTKILLAGAGGFAGSICRYLIADLSNKLFTNPYFPYGTLAANIIGCLFIGFLGGLSETRQIFTPEIRALVFIGFLGGFTTFSTFGYEIFNFARDGQLVQTLANLFVHLMLGLGAVWLGFSLSKLV